MRFLITPIALAGLALAGCYSPGIDDCQFACGTGDACPDGTRCMAGFCRSSTTGTCASSTIDAPPGMCPALPVGCTSMFTYPGGCGAVCTMSRDWTVSSAACTLPWKLAVLDTLTKIALAPTNNEYWVGAHRLSPTSNWMWVDNTPVDPAVWDNGQLPGEGSGQDCASLDPTKHRLVNSRQCTDTQPFLCTTP